MAFWFMKKIWQSIFILAVAALTFHTRAADISATWQFTGTVVDDQGRAVAGAAVVCYQYQSSWGWFGNMSRDPQIKEHAVTDSKGGFAFSSPPGANLVVVRKAGLAPAWKNWNSNLADSSEPLVLTAPTTLAGVVLDENDQPVVGAEVWVSDAIVGEVSSESQFNNLSGQAARDCFFAQTGADGRFRIENFPSDGYTSLSVSQPGKAQHPIGNTYLGARDFQSGQTNIELLLGSAGAVVGKVTGRETGEPLAGVKLSLLSTTGGSESLEPVQSAADGTFRVPDLLPDSYNIMATVPNEMRDWVMSVNNSGPVTVTAGETTSNVVIQVSQGALVEVTVVVTNELTPVANAVVSAGQSTAYTDNKGVALMRVQAGTNWFSARKDWRSQRNTAAIIAGQTNHVRIELIPPPRITGTVRDASGIPAAGVLVLFHPGQYPDAPDYAEVKTDKSGRYEMILKLSRETMAWDGEISPTNFILARSLERNLAAIQEFAAFPTNLDLTLQPGITLSGSVKNSEGAPVTNATVNLSILAGGSIPKLSPRPTKVDAQGSFTFPALPQGREYYFFQGITAKGSGTAGGRLKAEDSKTNHYEFPAFVLERADRILAGRVLDEDGHPLAGADVRFGGKGQQEWPTTKSDRHGNFFFDAVCEGEVHLSATAFIDGPPGEGIFLTDGGGSGVKAQAGDTNIVITLRDTSGRSRTPLHNAAQNGDLEKVKALLKKNPGLVSSKGTNSYGGTMSLRGGTALHLAARKGDMAMVALLLTSNADVNATDNDGRVPLHEATSGGHADVVELLLAHGADVNARANNGFTSLHWAALFGHADVAEVLLAHGAEVNAMNNNGATPLYWALYNGRKDVAELLRQHGALEQGYEAGPPPGATTNWDDVTPERPSWRP
jgi:protocatechuate 3,4-dioxygenase beta subunit